MGRRTSQTTPLESYHGVPCGWSQDEIISMHKKLGGLYSIQGKPATEPGAPSWLPDRYNWLQYRATLYRVCEGIKSNDAACIEIAVRFIELNHFGSYSGFIREKMARALKRAEISNQQISRLLVHFQNLIEKQECFQEFKEYKKLIRKFSNAEQATR